MFRNPKTSKTLLQKINENDEVSWNEFYETYSPLIRMFGMSFQLSPAERTELVQDVMLAVFNAQKTFHYDPAKGRFRGYLQTVTINCAMSIYRKRPKHAELDEKSDAIPQSPSDLDLQWNAEWNSYLLVEALKLLKDKMEPLTYQAFHLYALLGRTPKSVAEQLHISVNSVYLAKSRGIFIIREGLNLFKEEQNS